MFFNAKAILSDVSLFLDIDPKEDIVKDFFFEGPGLFHYQDELTELKSLSLGKSVEDLMRLKRGDLKHEARLPDEEKAISSIGLYLLKKALASYSGEDRVYREQKDLLCLCFSVTKRDIEQKVLSDKSYELKTLITDTLATSACGSCRGAIEALIVKTRLENGLIKGLEHSKSRFDQHGKWLKIAGLYPGELLLKLEALKNEWMKREEIEGVFQMEFLSIEGHHLEMSFKALSEGQSNEKTFKALAQALSDYFKAELGVLFFIVEGVAP